MNIDTSAKSKFKPILDSLYHNLFYQPQFTRDTGERSQDMMPSSDSSTEADRKLQVKQEYSVYKNYTDQYYDELEKQGSL